MREQSKHKKFNFDRLRILQLCNRVPYPPADGGTIAVIALLKHFAAHTENFHVLALNTLKHKADIDKIPARISKNASLKSVFIDTSLSPFKAFFNLFSNYPYQVERFYSEEFNRELILLLQREKFDIVHFESLFMTPYFETVRKYHHGKCIYRAHNIEFKIWERLLPSISNPLKKWYLGIQTSRLRKLEIEILNKFDAIVAITEEDKIGMQKTGANIPIHITPFGIDPNEYPFAPSKNKIPVLYHLGDLIWRPNAEGLRWFLENCWDKLVKEIPDIKFRIGGRHIPECIRIKGNNNLIVEGEVVDAKKFIAQNDILIVPLQSGGGMRVKIIEAMSMGKTVISTSIGAEGIAYTEGENILIANTAEEFMQQIIKCLSNPGSCSVLGEAARKLTTSKYNNEVLGNGLLEFYERLMSL